MLKVEYNLYTGEVLYYSTETETFEEVISKVNELGMDDYFIVGNDAFVKNNLRMVKAFPNETE